MKADTLVSVSVFYKNDTTTGFGVTICPETFEALQAECGAIWEGFKVECDNDDQIAGILIEQLEAYGQHKNEITTAEQMLCIMNIIQLVEHGYCPNDEYNGLQFTYVDAHAASILHSALFG